MGNNHIFFFIYNRLQEKFPQKKAPRTRRLFPEVYLA